MVLERPDTQFRIYRSTAVGDNAGGGIGAMTLPGTRIRGVVVDNPSGSWVRLDGVGLGFQPYVPPYTLAWSVTLLPSVTELTATYAPGPTGQPTSTVGAPIVVYIFESVVPSSAGSAFVVSTPIRTFFFAAFTGRPGVTTVPGWLPGVAGQRYRVHFIGIRHNADTSVNVTFVENVGGKGFGDITARPEQAFRELVYPDPGLDLPVGAGVDFSYAAIWGAATFELSFVYSVI